MTKERRHHSWYREYVVYTPKLLQNICSGLFVSKGQPKNRCKFLRTLLNMKYASNSWETERERREIKSIASPSYHIPLPFQIALTGSVYSIVGITVERYICCCFPHVPPREGPAINILAIGGIILFSVLFNMTRFFEYETGHEISICEGGPCLKVEDAYSDEVIKQGDDYDVAYFVDATGLRKNQEYIR